MLHATDNVASPHDKANTHVAEPLQMDTIEPTDGTMVPAFEKHTPPNEVGPSDMFEGNDIYSVHSHLRPLDDAFPKTILDDTNTADADNCTANTNMDTIQRIGEPSVFVAPRQGNL